MAGVVLEREPEPRVDGDEEVRPREEHDYAPPETDPRAPPPLRVRLDPGDTQQLLGGDLGDQRSHLEALLRTRL